MTNDDEAKAELFVKMLRKCGQPQSREDWKIVLVRMITVTDNMLREIGRQGRMLGCQWIVPVAEAILEELAAGRAYRASDGAITLREKPRAKGLDVLL